MKYYGYKSNLMSVKNDTQIIIIAPNKKEALKFARQFKGLIIGEKIKGYTRTYEDNDTLHNMDMQSKLIKESLDKKTTIIK